MTENGSEEVTKESSEEDVVSWLKNTVCLSDDDLDKFEILKELDGKLLFSYNIQSIHTFSDNLSGVPIGILRKIIILKENLMFRKHLSALLESKWTTSNVEQFIQCSLKIQNDHMKKICTFVNHQYIDGFVFFSYTTYEEMQRDFSKEKEHGILFQKIIMKRNAMLESTEIGKTLLKSYHQVPETHTSTSNKKEKQVAKSSSKPDLEVERYFSFLHERLHLIKTCSTDTSMNSKKICNLSIIYSTWKHKNEIEARVLFLVLSEQSRSFNDKSRKLLWSKIRLNMRKWRQSFSTTSQQLFVESEKDDYLIYGDQEICLSNEQPQMKPIMEKFKNPQDLHSIDNVFVLVAFGTFDVCTLLYEINLQTPDKDPISFHFVFDRTREYWHFNESFDLFLGTVNPDDCIQSTSSDEHISQKSQNNETLNDATMIDCIQWQPHRPFKASAVDIQYIAGKVFPTCESGGNLADRCFEYKYFSSSLFNRDRAVSKFILETLKFACGVLNSRKNGTIAFGIGDDIGKIDGKTFKHGEIAGFCIEEMDKDFRSFFTDALHSDKDKCFDDHSRSKAAQCIGDPVFIPVVTLANDSYNKRNLYVIEVDIEPMSCICENNFFKLNRSKSNYVGNSKKIESDFTLYVRKGSSTEKCDEEKFIYKPLERNIKEREIFDRQVNQPRQVLTELPLNKLEKLLCNGLDKFDSSFWPFLIISKPTTEQKADKNWIKHMKFIKGIECYCVFDFDDFSNEDGLCYHYRNKDRYELHGEEFFEDNSKRFDRLASDLGIPHAPKFVWLFANGRQDITPKRQHVNRKTWQTEYFGIRDAISFYSQIVPKRRAIVIVLLFADDFDGLIELFSECISRFGWDRIIIISVGENILKQFTKIIETEQRGSEDDVKKRSIWGFGTTWEHVSAALRKITGQIDESLTCIPVSSGSSGISLDENFKNAITELEIVGITPPYEYADETKLLIERQFYKGGKVSWSNFELGHVCTRHIFLRLKESIQLILSGKQESKQLVYTVIIDYQPGAGASTVARHLLWEFHKTFRCAVVKRLTSNTVPNIFSLWQYKEQENRNPLLLLIDELSESEFSPYELRKNIQKYYERENFSRSGPICCLLLCQRHVDVNERKQKFTSSFIDNSENLKHKMTADKIAWFNNKFKQMEKRQDVYRPDSLIAFLILRKDFNSTYITETITELLKTIQTESTDLKLLAFVALVSHFANLSVYTKRACVPIECCDELIGTIYGKNKAWDFWEKSLTDDKRIFLLTEENHHYNAKNIFKEIRVSHPSIAFPILQVLSEKQMPLSEITIQFLDSSIFKKHSLMGNCIIVSKTKEMLTRRLKEEYCDGTTTSYSPLIEYISSQEGWNKAADVLKKALAIVPDGYICQTLSKLLSKNKQFDEAVMYAEKSKDYATSREDSGFYYLSLGRALKDKFEYTIENQTDNNFITSTENIKSLMDAFELFLEAKTCVSSIGEISVLSCTREIIQTILLCGKFVLEKMQFKGIIDKKQLFANPDYEPEELKDVWKDIRPKLLTFVKCGQESFDFIQHKICYEPIYYTHDPNRLHRFHRILQYSYPSLLNDFVEIFGEDSDEPISQDIPEAIDEWHRRKVLKFMGNNYMDMFNLILLKFKRGKINLETAVGVASEIKGHLSFIKEKTPHDCINLVSVNFLLSILRSCGAKDRSLLYTIKDLIGFCELCAKTQGEYSDQAYFFLSMILWPSKEHDTNYDKHLFSKTLHHFTNRKVKSDYGRQKGVGKKDQKIIKKERNITRPSPQFFLGPGKGLSKVCHRFDIYRTSDDRNIWKRPQVIRLVKRIEGHIQYRNSRQYISVKNEMSPDDEIHINIIRDSNITSEEKVTFVLGFSLAGPMAYDVQLADFKQTVIRSPDSFGEDKMEFYYGKSQEELSEMLQRIHELKTGRHAEARLKNYRVLLEDEEFIKEALNLKEEDSD